MTEDELRLVNVLVDAARMKSEAFKNMERANSFYERALKDVEDTVEESADRR